MKCHFWAVQGRPQLDSVQLQGTPSRPRLDRLATGWRYLGRRRNSENKAGMHFSRSVYKAGKGTTGRPPWEALANICLETSQQILGRSAGPLQRPHLTGHQAENEQLDANVADALVHLQSFRGDEEPRDPQRHDELLRARQHSRRVSRVRKGTRLRWK